MLVSGMARPIYIWLPSLTAFALSACGGSESGFFSDLPRLGAGGSGHAGAAAHAGSVSISGGPGTPGGAGSPTGAGSPGSAGNLGSAGEEETGAGSGGAQAGGASSGGRAGANSGGTTGSHAGTGGSGAAGGRAGAPGAAGTGGSNQELSCSELLRQANDQLDAARACSMSANARQCTGAVMNTCNCQVSVQRSDSPETKAYLATLKQIKAKDCVTVCTAIACKPVSDGECKS